MYIPPFTISTNAINLIAEISAQIERYAIRLEQSDGLRLRKANRVRTIHSSLAIEGNMLSENEVKDIIDGKTVMAPLRQIQEVKNAIKTYELYEKLNPFDVNDLLKAHGTMMMALTDDAGKFRRGGVGVFSEERLVHMAPGPFIEFMLQEILNTLKRHQGSLISQHNVMEVRDKIRDKFGISSEQIIEQIQRNPAVTLDEIAAALSVTRRSIEKKIKELRDAGYIRREGSNKSGRWIVNDEV